MKRRDAIKTMPFLSTGLLGFPQILLSKEKRGEKGKKGKKDKPLYLEYLGRVLKIFEKIRSTELDNMLEAAYHIARMYKNGKHCFCQWETGHHFDGDMFPNRHGDTDLFLMGYTMGKPSIDPQKGDLLLVNVLRKPLEDPHKKGLFVIGGPTPWCGDTMNTELLTEANKKLKIKMYSDIWIETYITTHGALMWLPGETAPLGPTSGALGIVTFWAMIADAVRILARDGITVKVKGDEPDLGKNNPYISLSKPLGEAYFNQCELQIKQIAVEHGKIKKIAGEIAERILSGGKLYVYSRYIQALSLEANAKRGGLALIKTTHAEDKNFKGTGKDFMIMGIYQPDDEVDLQMLKKYHKMGMKVAAVGPITREGKIPAGKNTPGEADYHLGLMCDTYGLFAVPGVKKKVCPTSGLLVNLMFWATAIQLAEEIMKRTGETPGVLSTGAMIGGGEQRRRRMEMVKIRGY